MDRFLHLQIVQSDGVRFFCAHKRNNYADEHGNGDHIESIVHEEKGRQRGKGRGKKEEMCVEGKVNLTSGESRRVKNCTLKLVGRCVRSYMHVRWQYAILSRSAEQNTFCYISRQY